LRLEVPVVAIHGDRFIIRSYSPAETIAGGLVMDPFAAKHRAREFDEIKARLSLLMSDSPTEKVRAFVESAGTRGLKRESLIAATGWKRTVLDALVDRAQEEREVVDAGGALLSSESFEALSRKVVNDVEAYHKREPLARGMLRETLREKAFAHSLPELFGAVISSLVASGKLIAEKDVVRSASHTVDLSDQDSELRKKLEQIFIESGVEAPSLEDLMTRAGVVQSKRPQARRILQLLIDEAKIVRIHNEMFMHSQVVGDLKTKLLEYAIKHEPDRLIDVAAFKELAGVSRKYAIPLLEYFDQAKVTRRAGDKRLILK
jgi:selenocysteine-specific elongation factor